MNTLNESSSFAPRQGWIAAYRDVRALKASDANIPIDFVRNLLSLDFGQCCFLLEACCKDEKAVLFDLSEEQLQMLYENSSLHHGKVVSRVLDAVRHGLASYICSEWAQAVACDDGSEEDSLAILRLYRDKAALEADQDNLRQQLELANKVLHCLKKVA